MPSFGEGVRVWSRIATLSFGGPAGQIAVMHRTLVEEKRWISESRFLHALNYCMLLPGPEAQQLVTYVAWLLHGTGAAILAGSLFVLPGFVSILALSLLYVSFQDVAIVQALLYGLKPAVMAIVVEAVIRIGKRALKGRFALALAAAAFVAIFLYDVPFPVVVGGAAVLGLLNARLGAGARIAGAALLAPEAALDDPDVPIIDRLAPRAVPTLGRTLRVVAICLALWWLPVALVAAWCGPDSTLAQLGVFFSKAAVVTFGGAYSVLAYVAQQAVEVNHWLTPKEMLDGLGMAETTPGPLIQVVQFVAFLAGHRNAGGLPPVGSAIAASVLTTWVTYVPCFLFIFVGAPFVESLRRSRALSGALSAITAAVVGVVLNLAAWFSIHTLFGRVGEVRALGMHVLIPDPATLDIAGLIIAVAAGVAVLRYKAGMLPTLAASMAAGLVVRLLLGGGV